MGEQKQEDHGSIGTEDEIKEYGMTDLEDPVQEHRIHLMTIIGEIEGHDVLPNTSKATKYEHVRNWRRLKKILMWTGCSCF